MFVFAEESEVMVNEVDEMCIVVDTVVDTIVSVEFSEYEVEVSKVDEVVVDEVDEVCIVVDTATVVDTIVSVELSEYEVEVSKVDEVVVEEVDEMGNLVDSVVSDVLSKSETEGFNVVAKSNVEDGQLVKTVLVLLGKSEVNESDLDLVENETEKEDVENLVSVVLEKIVV